MRLSARFVTKVFELTYSSNTISLSASWCCSRLAHASQTGAMHDVENCGLTLSPSPGSSQWFSPGATHRPWPPSSHPHGHSWTWDRALRWKPRRRTWIVCTDRIVCSTYIIHNFLLGHTIVMQSPDDLLLKFNILELCLGPFQLDGFLWQRKHEIFQGQW